MLQNRTNPIVPVRHATIAAKTSANGRRNTIERKIISGICHIFALEINILGISYKQPQRAKKNGPSVKTRGASKIAARVIEKFAHMLYGSLGQSGMHSFARHFLFSFIHDQQKSCLHHSHFMCGHPRFFSIFTPQFGHGLTSFLNR